MQVFNVLDLLQKLTIAYLLLCCPVLRAQPSITVGETAIADTDIALRAQLNALQPGRDDTREIAAYQLLLGEVHAQVAAQIGPPITDSILNAEVQRIAKNTLMPARLDSLYRACPDSASFVRVYVRPDFAGRWLRYQFSTDTNYHLATAGRRAQNLLQTVQVASFDIAAQAQGLRVDTVLFSVEKGLHAPPRDEDTAASGSKFIDISKNTPPPKVQAAMDAQLGDTAAHTAHFEQLMTQLSNMPVGDVYDKLLQGSDYFSVAQRLPNAEAGVLRLRVVRVPFVRFDRWLETQLTTIQVAFNDAALLKHLRERIPKQLERWVADK